MEEKRVLKADILHHLRSTGCVNNAVTGTPMPVPHLEFLGTGYDIDLEAVVDEMAANDEMPFEYATPDREQVWITDRDDAYDVFSEIREKIYSND